MFSLKDTTRFFGSSPGVDLTKRQIAILHEALEGWPVGLRLIMLAIQNSGNPERLITNLPNGHPRIQRYLIEEVLSDLDPIHRECMRRISLLDRFCEPLNRALCSNACNTCPRELNCMFAPGDSGRSMVWNPLSIPLDEDGKWFRYHHQFQKLLQEHLQTGLSSQEVYETYEQASVWLENNGYIDESIKYAFRVSAENAIEIVSRHRHSLMNKECWVQLRQWVKIFDQEIINSSPELLLLQAWCNVGYPEMFTALEKAGKLLSELKESSTNNRQRGELLAYRSLGYYAQGSGDEIVVSAQESLKLLEPDQLCEKGFASILLAMGMQLKGEWVEARDLIQRTLGDDTYADTTYHTRLWAALCFGFWNDADTHQLKSSAREYLELGRQLRFAESIDHGLYFCGLVHYAFNELEQAQDCLTELIENPSISNMHNYLHAAYVLALSYVASDQPEKADALVEKLVAMSMKSRQSSVIAQARAFEAEIALRTGRIAEAKKWLFGFDVQHSRPILWRFYVPHLTRIRVFLALGDPDSIEIAIHDSAAFCAHAEQVHHTHFLIISLIQHALALWAGERMDEALKSMAKAVELALPGGAIRPFIDEGGQIAPLLNQLKMKPEALRFTGRVLAAFRDAEEDSSSLSTLNLEAGLLDPLSAREREVLKLLAGPLENKAIAEKLFISPGTVKRHTNSIYSKLSVHSRRAAVDKARGLGLLDV
jgi:LuxR family maltose regulon positive regulatory protein